MIRSGYERDRLDAAPLSIRWWLYLEDEEGRARNQQARKGVVDRGFHFARGGRVNTEQEADECLRLALIAAQAELVSWQHQPSHALGPGGQLIPLDEVADMPVLDAPPGRALGSGE